jgi:hypothetical protein
VLILDQPPELVLPERYREGCPAIIRPNVDLARYFPVEVDRRTRRAIVSELVKQGRVEQGAIPFGMFVRKGVQTLTYNSETHDAASTAGSLAVPAATAAGDLLVMHFRATNAASATPGDPSPSGWTKIGHNASVTTGSTRIRHVFFFKIAIASEPSVPLSGTNVTACRRAITLFKGDVVITSATAGDFQTQVTASDPTAQVVPAAVVPLPFVVFGSWWDDGGNAVSPRTMSPAKDAEIAQNTSGYFGWRVSNSSPVDVTVDTDDNGDVNVLSSFWVRAA